MNTYNYRDAVFQSCEIYADALFGLSVCVAVCWCTHRKHDYCIMRTRCRQMNKWQRKKPREIVVVDTNTSHCFFTPHICFLWLTSCMMAYDGCCIDYGKRASGYLQLCVANSISARNSMGILSYLKTKWNQFRIISFAFHFNNTVEQIPAKKRTGRIERSWLDSVPIETVWDDFAAGPTFSEI